MADTKFSQFASGTTTKVGDISVGLRAGVNTQFAFPGTGINDASDNKLLEWVSGGALATNFISFSSALVGVDPTITGTGSGANVGLTLTTKGTGDISLIPATTGVIKAESSVRFKAATAIQTSEVAGNTLLFQAYDTDAPGFITFATLTAGSTPTFSISATSLTLTTPLAVTSGGTGVGTAFTQGSVVFAGPSGIYAQDNAALFYDNANFRLGVNTAAPAQTLDVFGITQSSSFRSNVFSNSAGDTVFICSSPGGVVENSFNFTPSIAGNPPIISLFGSDTNIGMTLQTKATGIFDVQSESVAPISFLSGPGLIHRATFQFANSISTQTIIFPDGNGTVAYVAGGHMSWSTVSGTSQLAAVNSGYVIGNGALTTVTLPAVAAIGSIVAIEGLGLGGWVLTAGAGQTIKIGTSTTSVAGTLSSVASSDNVYVTCIVANTTWRVSTTNSTGLTVI